MNVLLMFGLIAVAVFLILVVLVQRGRGGGLAGALGGMGGQSAFGTKAGDTFTKITIWTAVVWILLCVVAVKYLSTKTQDTLGDKGASTSESIPVDLPGLNSKGSKKGGETSTKPSGAAPATGDSKPAPATTPAIPPPAPAPPASSK
ncbi:MAG: preprotein translocase subunit SecG [Planctomycetes bacterium]|nr:preprotein translocase subunit SecG [Planctomycetota bacterium]